MKKKSPLQERLDRFERFFYSDTWPAALLWFACAVAMMALLVWFLAFSGYAAPSASVYEGF